MQRPTLTNEYWARTFPPSLQNGVSLGQALRVLRRAWAWILIPTLLAAGGAVAFVQVVPPRYTAETKILLESRDPTFARNAAERADQATPMDEQGVASQAQVVMSRDIAREAVRRLNLVGNPEFDAEVGEVGPVKRVLMMLGLGRNLLDGKPEDRVLDAYFDRLLVYPAGKSRILSVEFRSRDPELSAKASNTVAELYLASLEAAKVDTARYASTWLGTNIDTLRARVAEAEAKVEAYRARNGLTGTGAGGQPLTGQQLGELSSQLSQARTMRADLAGRVKVLKEMIKEGRAFEIPDVANNELIRRTVESRMTLRAQLALESRTLLPAHPRIKELSAQVEDLEAQIKAAAERIVRTLENDAKIAGARVDSLQAAVDGQRDVVVKGKSSEIELRALEREAKAQREQLESYLARFREASARDAESATPADARIVSRAVVPELPSFPKKVPTIAFATALAFMLSAAAVLGRHLLRTPEGGAAAQAEGANDRMSERTAGESDPAPLADRFAYPEPMPPSVMGRPIRVEANDDRPEDRPAEAPVLRPAFGRQQGPVVATGAGFANGLTASVTYPAVEGLGAGFGAGFGEGLRLRGTLGGAAKDPAAATPPLAADADATPRATARTHALDALIGRLEAVAGHGGRCVLVIETGERKDGAARGTAGLATGLATMLSRRAGTLLVDASGAATGPRAPGLTDLVAGESDFLDVIHPAAGARHHVVPAGATDPAILFAEPQSLAIGLNAMAQAYDWVICRLDGTEADAGESLISALSACMDSVVIASDADPEDAALVALYGLAAEAGAGQVLVAREGTGRDGTGTGIGAMDLRLSA